jgi:hypothetical protein
MSPPPEETDRKMTVERYHCFPYHSWFPISPSHPAATGYKAAKGELIREIERQLNEWRAVSLFEIGENEAEAKPVVLILVKPGAEYDWAALQVSLEQILQAHGSQSTHIGVQFCPGELRATMSGF